MKTQLTFSAQLSEAKDWEARRDYAKASAIFEALYKADFRHQSAFIMEYSLYLERRGQFKEAVTLIQTFLATERRIDARDRQNLDRRLNQLGHRLEGSKALSGHEAPTDFKPRGLTLSRRDLTISGLLLILLASIAIYSNFYKESYEAKLLDMKLEDLVKTQTLTLSEDEDLPPISEKSLRSANQLLSQTAALRRSQIIVKNGMVGIAAVVSDPENADEARAALYSALRQLSEANSGGPFHLRSPTKDNLGGLFDYYGAALIITDSSRQPVDTGIKLRTHAQLYWENQ